MSPKIHLCQPDGRKSCGACCGMYNTIGATRESTDALLRARRETLTGSPCELSLDALAGYREQRLAEETPDKLLPLLRNCPFLGVLDEGTGRVGCMVHPKVCHGRDGRDLGLYDRETCENYLCAAFTHLSPREIQLIVRACGDDSFLYGLVLNDIGFLRGLFQGVADVIGLYPNDDRLLHPTIVEAVAEYMALKVDWPYGDPEAAIIGAYLPDGDENVLRRSIDYAELGLEPSRFDTILTCLGSLFDEAEDVREAEAIVYGAIYEVATRFEALIGASRAG